MDFNGQKSSPYLVDILHQHGIVDVIICPGSRNAPLTLAFSRHGQFNCISLVDERSAGYFAIGLAQASKKPVALVCTSGTATLNFAPAIAEAFHLQIPLIALTADRAEAWIGQQDGQAMNQKNIYANIIARSYHLVGELYCADDLWYTERIVNEACGILFEKRKPVHINCAFAEPLYQDDFKRAPAKYISFLPSQHQFLNWPELLDDKKKILVVIGQGSFNGKIRLAIETLKENGRVVVLAENLANIDPKTHIPNATEALLYAKETPDVIIYLGGAIVSKQLKKYISNTQVSVIRVQLDDVVVDTFKNSRIVVKADIEDGIVSLSQYLVSSNIESSYAMSWRLASEMAINTRNKFLAAAQFSDLKIFEFLTRQIPAHSVIHLANSTPVRYAQVMNDLYSADCKFYANRGTSGIDGSSSTAVGYAYGTDQLNFLITGDLSFQYDANAFFNRYLKGNLKIIIINNSGGNIFRIIDGPKGLKERDDYFEAAVDHEFSNLAKHFDLNYFSAENEKDLHHIWHEFLKTGNNRPSVLEIFTDAEISANTFKQLYKSLDS